jgi:hypothetical protein
MRTRPIGRPLSIEQLVERVRTEYAALPGLNLTEAQVRRLFGLDPSECGNLLRRLVEAGVLTMAPGGQYVRADLKRYAQRGRAAQRKARAR